MKAPVIQQQSLRELAEIDAELTRVAHRAANLAEQLQLDAVRADRTAAADRLAVLGIAAEDLDDQVRRLESEIDGVRQREDRDRALLADPATAVKQLADLQHELDTLQRRQSALEDTELELMERREELARQQEEVAAEVAKLDEDAAAAQQARDAALVDIDGIRAERTQRRESLTAELDAELLALYERQRASSGVGAGVLQGRRCGACRLDLDRGELSRIAAAADDDVLRCPECGAILLRVKVSEQ